MSTLKNIGLFIGVPLAIVAVAAFKNREEQHLFTSIQTDTTGKGMAVVELFTSEGCSSCPPADQLLEKLQHKGNKQIYLLAFHVDYWNRLGWKDRFSKADFSERQKQYASWLHADNIYTPQMVINGEREMVGSNESAVLRSIQTALTKESLPFSIRVKTEANKVLVSYTDQQPNPDMELVIALVKKQASSSVLAGENEGKQLTHVQIVEALQHAELNATDTILLDAPDIYKKGDWEIIGLIQNKNTGKIIGATRADL